MNLDAGAANDVLDVYFTAPFAAAGATALSIPPSGLPVAYPAGTLIHPGVPLPATFTNWVFVSLTAPGVFANLHTVAHEMGHQLGNQGHGGQAFEPAGSVRPPYGLWEIFPKTPGDGAARINRYKRLNAAMVARALAARAGGLVR